MSEQSHLAPAVCTMESCAESALYAYTWDWGESGYCCGPHAVTLNHRAAALSRICTLVALKPGAAEPVTQDERTQMHARLLGAQDTIDDLKNRGRQLFEANQVLVQEVNRLTTERTELLTEMGELRAAIEQLAKEKAQLIRQLAERTDEMVRLKAALDASDLSAP